ncbi:MAG: 50S ribosomal protein L18 [Christensenellaceae bacterium]|jgi:large subunit ribosomal protein L18|nr:50S ribosomal protein L18 [Christensenellaceae bacterium]
MFNKPNKNKQRQKRHLRLRSKVSGTPVIPRLSVYRSLKNIYTQIIDDESGVTLVAASTMEKDIASKLDGKTKVAAASIVGEAIAVKALEKGIKKIVFDRGGYLYTGRIQAVADGARKGGLEF